MFMQDSEDTYTEAKAIGVNAPYIFVCEATETTSYCIAVEQEPFIETWNIESALIDLVSSYFVFDIQYPTSLNSLLIFIQHYVLCLEDDQPDPPSVIEMVTSLKHMDSVTEQ